MPFNFLSFKVRNSKERAIEGGRVLKRRVELDSSIVKLPVSIIERIGEKGALSDPPWAISFKKMQNRVMYRLLSDSSEIPWLKKQNQFNH